MIEQIILETIYTHVKDKEMTRTSQEGLTKGKSLAWWMRGEQCMFLISTLNKAFDTVSHNVLIDKLSKFRIGKWTVKRTEN